MESMQLLFVGSESVVAGNREHEDEDGEREYNIPAGLFCDGRHGKTKKVIMEDRQPGKRHQQTGYVSKHDGGEDCEKTSGEEGEGIRVASLAIWFLKCRS